MATWKLSDSRPFNGERRRLVSNKAGEQGFASVNYSTYGRGYLFGVVFVPHLNSEGQEIADREGIPVNTTLDTNPKFA